VRIIDSKGGNVTDACFLAVLAALRGYRKPEVNITTREGNITVIHVYKDDERDALPLALHYSPVAVSIAICKMNISNQEHTENRNIYILDPLQAEIDLLDTQILYFINSHKEICMTVKSGGYPLPVQNIITTANLAIEASNHLHELLEEALKSLEDGTLREREKRLEILQLLRSDELVKGIETTVEINEIGGGIDRDDPILQWGLLHQASITN
jgi:exosome complex RNA-binding protein Rrp42 (RNase PH superfamily)